MKDPEFNIFLDDMMTTREGKNFDFKNDAQQELILCVPV